MSYVINLITFIPHSQHLCLHWSSLNSLSSLSTSVASAHLSLVVKLRSWSIGVNSLILIVTSVSYTAAVLSIWHQVAVKHVAADADIINLEAPVTEILLSIVEDLASLWTVLEQWTGVARDDWSIIEQVQETTAVASEDDLLLGTDRKSVV